MELMPASVVSGFSNTSSVKYLMLIVWIDAVTHCGASGNNFLQCSNT